MEFGLIGEHLGHSWSPQIHARLADYRYELREVAPQDLDAFLRARDFRGLNVTIPYKRDVIPLCDELSGEALEIGAVNTLLVRPDGTLYGHNTDIGGFMTMLRRARIDPAGRKAVVLGSGGTGRTACTALKRMGAAAVVTVSRRGPVDYDALYRDHADAEILVNTTPVGMYPRTGTSPADLERLPALRGVADVVYNPESTALILDARARGIPCTSGLPMLVAQARLAAELFSGHAIDPGADDAIIAAIKAQTLNLILMGMPGCGKTTMAHLLASSMGRECLDVDGEIVRRAGVSIPEIFRRDGEEAFRDLESEVLADLCRESGRVIAIGGGSPMREENRRAMRQNGRVCLILRDLGALPLDGRPVSRTRGVERLWEERRPVYEAAADYTVRNDTTPEAAAGAIREGFYEAARH